MGTLKACGLIHSVVSDGARRARTDARRARLTIARICEGEQGEVIGREPVK